MLPGNFIPPRCPNRRCPMFASPTAGFWRRRGWYQTQCRLVPTQRFICVRCRRSFSRQTFRIDYRDKRPAANEALLSLLASGVGLRQSARCLKLDVHAIQKKARKLARHMGLLNRNLIRKLPAGSVVLLDEAETFEHRKFERLTMPVMIDRQSRLILATRVAPIRRAARKGSRRRRRQEAHEQRFGARSHRGPNSVRIIMGRLRRLLHGRPATLISDEKPSYASICRRRFSGLLKHVRVPSRLPRNTFNPLFAMNLTQAMLRDNCGRLRQRSWLASKRRRYLHQHLELFSAYRNWHRQRNNDDPPGFTPGVCMGITSRSLSLAELLTWRQDWRLRSCHPCSPSGAHTILDQVG